MVPPLDQLPGGILKLLRRRQAVRRISRSEPDQSAAQARCAFTELQLHPRPKGPLVDPRRLLLGKLFEARIDHRLHGALAQDLRAERMNGADRGFLQMLQRILDVDSLGWTGRRIPSAVQILPQPQLQFARGLVGERHGNDAIDGGDAFGQHPHNTRHQFSGLPRASRRFYQQTLVQRGSDALTRGQIVELRFQRRRHGWWRISISGSSRPGSFRLTRCSSYGPQTAL